MNERVKKLWIDALRGDEYQQGQTSLRPTDDTFCCLGVLCDLYHRETANGAWVGEAFVVDGEHHQAALPGTVSTWAGLEYVDPPLGEEPDTAMSLNDRGYTFAQIADRIERYL